jgi:hypothetical protein
MLPLVARPASFCRAPGRSRGKAQAAVGPGRARPRKQLEPLRQRGEAAWHEVESEIELRNPAGYKKAFDLMRVLKMLERDELALNRRGIPKGSIF